MEIFLLNYCIILTALCIYGLIGGFSIVPFRSDLKYPILVAPIAGMLLLPMGVFLLYSFVGLSVKASALIIIVICSLLTVLCLISLKVQFRIKNNIPLGFFVLMFSAVVTYLSTYTSIEVGSLGFLYREGTDHLGYAGMADWLNDHLIKEAPIANSSYPYQSFSAFLIGNDHEMLGSDPLSSTQRFGSFFTLAIIASLIDQSSTFSYDIACAIILIASYLGISALYSFSRTSLILLSFSLLIGFWFTLSKTGFFGKLMGFPTIPFILGLYFLQQKNNVAIIEKKISWVVILLLTFAAAMVYPGEVLAIFLIVIGGLFLIFKTIDIIINWRRNEVINLCDNAGLLLIMLLIAFSAQGLLSLPRSLHALSNTFPTSWSTVLLNQFDIRYIFHDLVFSWYSENISIVFFIISILISIIGLFITLIQKDIVASSLIASALCLLGIPYLIENKWVAYEFSGALYPLTLCGFAWFISNSRNTLSVKQNQIYLFFVLMIIAMIIRLPSFTESVHRFTKGGIPSSLQYSKEEIDQLKRTIGQKSVIVDIPHVMFALPILIELGREQINLQWTPDSWKAVLGYRPWKPKSILPSNLILGLNYDALTFLGLTSIKNNNCKVILTTRQYQLYECDNILTATNFPYTYKKNSSAIS